VQLAGFAVMGLFERKEIEKLKTKENVMKNGMEILI